MGIKKKAKVLSSKKKEMKTFEVCVTETYTKTYVIDATEEDEAIEIAESMAEDDLTIADPHNFNDREVEVVGVK